MNYANYNLAADIPQHIVKRAGPRKNGKKNKTRDLWAEKQVPVKRRPAFYQAGRSYIPRDGAGLSEEFDSNTPEPQNEYLADVNPELKYEDFEELQEDFAELSPESLNAADFTPENDAPSSVKSEKVTPKSITSNFSLKALLIVLSAALFAILAYNALLWQRNYNALAPADDKHAEDELRGFAYQVQPPAAGGDEIPLPLTETYSWEEYRVKKGDTISGIAKNFGLSMDAVISLNNISRARALRENELLKIPNMDGVSVTVKKSDTLNKLSASFGVPMTAILDANDLTSETLAEGAALFIPGAKMKGEELRAVIGDMFIYPVKGRLTSQFGWRNDPISGSRRFHAAIDLAVAAGTPVAAAMAGRVSSTGFNSTYGNYIILTHSGDWTTMYAHLSKVSVTQDSKVVQGQEIGKAGSTGYSTGPHLHFALYKNNRALNPLDYLKF